MKIVAWKIPSRQFPGIKALHLKLPKGKRYVGHERLIARHIGPRPWSEMFWMEDGHVNLVYVK